MPTSGSGRAWGPSGRSSLPTWNGSPGQLDSALYPALLAGYLMMGFFDDPSPWMRVPICLVVIWGCAWLNIRGVKEVGDFLHNHGSW